MQAGTACFSRPEFPAEKSSYPIITPPAAVGALSAVFWKPQFRWHVARIEMLNVPEWFTYRTNGVTKKASTTGVISPRVKTTKNSTQIGHLGLLRPAYLVHFDLETRGELRSDQSKTAFFEQAHRRLANGQFFKPPYLGMREHLADIGLPDGTEQPVDFTLPVGPMVHSYRYGDTPKDRNTVIETRWFNATIINGVLEVPREPMP